MHPIEVATYFVVAPALLIYIAIRFRQLRRLPALAVPVYRLHVAPLKLLIPAAILLALAFFLAGALIP